MRKIALFLFLLVSFLNLSAQQTRQITGMVTDGQLGDPLIGVSVAIKGSTLGAVTDVSGKYSIRIPANQQTVLVFRYIGYVSREVTVGTENTINIKLSQEDKSLNEVVVIGYGEVQRRDVTGAVGSVKVEELQDRKSVV